MSINKSFFYFLFLDDCNEDQLSCGAESQCVSKGAICDGNPDCTMYLDERNCGIYIFIILNITVQT